jgi:two-component system, chemotaxis family, protein-glutamate methylesterase/glutaminase
VAISERAGRDLTLKTAGGRRDVPEHDIVVIGGSAGSIEALRGLVSLLPARLPSALFLVVHVLPTAQSRLPHILGIRGPLPVQHAVSGDRIQRGRILVAPPDHHLLLHHGYVELNRGPRVNSARPAIDPLFQSAAETFGPRVCGIVLSGNLDDGSNGLRLVAERGGSAIVQDPEQALYPEMPKSALRRVPGARVMEVEDMARALARAGIPPRRGAAAGAAARGRYRAEEADLRVGHDHDGTPTGLTCPECHGALWTSGEPWQLALECRVGHRFTFDSLQEEQHASVERALWAAVRSLREDATLARHLADRAVAGGREQAARRHRVRQRQADQHADVLQGLIFEEPPEEVEGEAAAT